MNKPDRGGLNETLTSVYLEQFCSGADRVYRLAFSACLDLIAAQKVVEQVFRSVADELARLSPDSDADILLLKLSWPLIKSLKTTQRITSGGSILDALAAMPLEARVTVTAIDVLGLSREEMAEVFGWKEADWRKYLAMGRKIMLTSPVGNVELPPEEVFTDENI